MAMAQANSRGDVPVAYNATANLPAAFVGARVFRTTNQAINSDSVTAVQFDNESYDTDGFHDNVTNNTRLTIPSLSGYSGGWRISAIVVWAASATGGRDIEVYKNGAVVADVVGAGTNNAGAGTGETHTCFGFVGSSTAGDYFELKVAQNSGAPLNVTGASFAISMVKK